MPREKKPVTCTLYYVNTHLYVPPAYPSTMGGGKVPAIDAVTDDGRRVWVTFESHVSAGSTLDKAGYARRMRLLAHSILNKADQLDPPEGNRA